MRTDNDLLRIGFCRFTRIARKTGNQIDEFIFAAWGNVGEFLAFDLPSGFLKIRYNIVACFLQSR